MEYGIPEVETPNGRGPAVPPPSQVAQQAQTKPLGKPGASGATAQPAPKTVIPMPQAGGLKAPEHYGIPNPIWAVWQKITDDKFSGTEYFMLYWVSVGISVIYSELLRLNLISNGVAIWLFFIAYILPVLSGWYAYFQADSTGRLPGYFGTMYVWLAAITSHQVIWPFLLVLMGAKVR